MNFRERRSSSRQLSLAKGYIILNGIDLDLRMHDISSGGALVEFASHYAIREGTKFRIHLDIGYVGMAIVCRVADSERALFAVRFEEELPETVTIH